MTKQDGKPPTRFNQFRNKADTLVQSPDRVQGLMGDAVKKIGNTPGKFTEIKDQLFLAIAMVRASMTGDYKELSRKTIVALVAALLYFVVPIDVIPDFLFGWGFLDDAAVLGYVLSQLSTEVEAFKVYQQAQKDKAQSQENSKA